MEVSLQKILEAREQRAKTQRELLETYQKPLICFTLNIPGPVKFNRDIAIAFAVGNRLLQNLLHGQSIIYHALHYKNTGCEGYYVVDQSAAALKQLAISMEDTEQIGRLFDVDVLDTDGNKLSREEFGFAQRKCFICDNPAVVCARSRAHGLEQLKEKVRESLKICAQTWLPELIAAQAWLALNHEFAATPKPGLVDRNNQGSHKDMNIKHFFASSNALQPYFQYFAEMGLSTRDASPAETFSRIRSIGLDAEKAMYKATGGVNTHKGAIFSIGLFCAAAGRLSPEFWTPELLCKECAAMTQGIVAADFAGVTAETAKTVGEQLFVRYGITGIRGQAESGYPAVLQAGLPILQQGLLQGLSLNDAGCCALLHLMAATDDTNLIHRSDRETQVQIRAEIAHLLAQTPYPTMETIGQLDNNFIQKNLSPGGSADLLAVTYFLHFLTT